jgi:hypothetical protein
MMMEKEEEGKKEEGRREDGKKGRREEGKKGRIIVTSASQICEVFTIIELPISNDDCSTTNTIFSIDGCKTS